MSSHLFRHLLITATTLLAVAACQAAAPSLPHQATDATPASSIAVSAASSIAPVPTIDPDWTQRPFVTCGADGPLFPSAMLEATGHAETERDPAALALHELLITPDEPENAFPKAGWSRVLQTADQAVFVAPTGGDPAWMVVGLRSNAGRWSLDLSGACQPTVSFPKGVGAAEWRVDPSAPVDPTSDSVRLLATELACASGKAPDGRVLTPIVAAGKDVVGITVLVRHAPGGQDCPSNPEFPLTVQLGAPIGHRTLYDASVFPPARR